MITLSRRFVAYWWFVQWSCISFGFHIDVRSPNIEIHLPFGFFRIGWETLDKWEQEVIDRRTARGYEGVWSPPLENFGVEEEKLSCGHQA